MNTYVDTSLDFSYNKESFSGKYVNNTHKMFFVVFTVIKNTALGDKYYFLNSQCSWQK